MSIASGLEMRRRKRATVSVRFPAVVLAVAVCLSLGAQVVDAERSVIGWIAAAIPALGFLVIVKVAFAQGGGPSAVTTPKLRVVDLADDAILLAAAGAAAEELERQGRRVSRQALAEALRATRHAVSNAKASALLGALKAEAAEEDPPPNIDAASGHTAPQQRQKDWLFGW